MILFLDIQGTDNFFNSPGVPFSPTMFFSTPDEDDFYVIHGPSD